MLEETSSFGLSLQAESFSHNTSLNDDDQTSFNNELSKINQLMKISFLHIQNKKINFIRNLSQISCPLLTTIEFRNNQIDSIEPFSRASVPSLKTLLIGRNYILYFRTFRKMNAPDFSNLDIDHNYICDAQSLTQLNAAKSLSEIDLDWSQCREMSCDYRWMFKMQAQSLGNFLIRSPKRIQQPKIKQKLNHKFLNIGIPHPN